MSFSANYPTSAPSLLMDFANSNAVDPRVTFTRASTATYYDSIGTLQSAAVNSPRLDYNPSTLAAQGLLIEESRTNSIRNSTATGAVAGTPGTLPTNWSGWSAASGITREIVGTGSEAGVNYIDFKLSGTASAAVTFFMVFDTTNPAAASGQSWTSSTYVKLQAGSTTNISNFTLRIDELDSGGVLLINSSVAISPTSAALSTQRSVISRTFSNASTAFAREGIRFEVAIGLAIDITLRIGLPQLELGAFATSVIPTSTVALTRAADVASVNTLSPWYNAAEGTVYAESAVFNVTTQTQLVWQLVGGANSTSLRSPQTTGARLRATVGNTFSGAATGASIINNTFIKSAVAWQGLSGRLQSGAVGEDITAATTVTGTQLNIGNLAGGSYLNGYISRLTYYPRRLTNAQLQAITS